MRNYRTRTPPDSPTLLLQAMAKAKGSRPEGLDAVNAACRQLYPKQRNPLQVTAVVKFWLGGPDPLDYISMYHNSGDSSQQAPPHWHYVSCGLSDLHGDGRVHEVTGPEQCSGFGFELTFRLKKEQDEKTPPTWPADLMQALARYVFHSGNALCSGDHVSWHQSLDRSDSQLQHLLVVNDPQLMPLSTPLGSVRFVQIVAVMREELEAAQKWNGMGVLQLMRKHSTTGGQWLVSDMRRGESLFDVDSSAKTMVEEGWSRDGSNLSGVSVECDWEDGSDEKEEGLKKGDEAGDMDLQTIKSLSELHLQLTMEAVRLLPLAIKGRLVHQHHFTFKSFSGEKAVTLVCGGVDGCFANEDQPFAHQGPWLQVHFGDQLCQDVLGTLEPLLYQSELSLPHKLNWPKHHLALTILPTSISIQNTVSS